MGERLARVEVEIKHMATKAELANMKVWTYGTIGSGIAVLLSFAVILYRILSH